MENSPLYIPPEERLSGAYAALVDLNAIHHVLETGIAVVRRTDPYTPSEEFIFRTASVAARLLNEPHDEDLELAVAKMFSVAYYQAQQVHLEPAKAWKAAYSGLLSPAKPSPIS